MTTDTEPYIESRESIEFVDATPDGGYALRILEAYRKRCDWVFGDSAKFSPALQGLQQRTRERVRACAEELDAAIEMLRDLRRWKREERR